MSHQNASFAVLLGYIIFSFLLGWASPLPLDDTGTTTMVFVGPLCVFPLEVARRVTVVVLPFGKVVVCPLVDVVVNLTAEVEGAEDEGDAAVVLAVGSTFGLTGELSIFPIATAPLRSAN